MNYCQFRNDVIKRMANAGGGVLPPEYQQVEWIENGGTGRCYIGINQPVYNTYHFSINFEIVNEIGGSITGGNDVSNEPYPLATINLYYPNAGMAYIVNKGYDFKTNLSAGVKYTIDLWQNNSTFFCNINGVPISGTTAGNSDNSALCLFYSTWGGYAKPCKLYGVKIRDSYNGNELYSFVPCYRKSDNKPGVYDIVNSVFYDGKLASSNPGTYIVGNDVL